MQYTTWLRWGILAGLFAILFIPFLVATGTLLPNMFFPYITGKNFAFRILVELIFLLYAILALKDPQYRPKGSHIMWATLAFVAWMGLATITSVDPVKSFWSNFERMDGYITVIHLFALFIVAGAVLPVNGLWKRFLQTSIAASFIMGCYGLLQVMHVLSISSQSGSRVDTTFGNAIYIGVYMLFNIFFTLFLLVREGKSRGMQALYGIALVLQFTTLIYSQSRGPVLGVVGGLILAALYIVIFGRGSELRPLRRISFITLGVIVVLGVGVFAARDTAFVKSSPALARLASVSLSEGTVQSRLNHIWPIAIQGGLEKPITGWGEENFSFVFNEHYPPQMYNQEQWFDRAHNQFLDWLVAGGVPAFLLYISLFVLAALAFIRSDALLVPEKAVLLGLLAAYAFNNVFVFDNVMSVIYFYLLIAFAHGLSRQPLPRFIALSKPLGDRAIAVVAPLVAIVVLGGVWIFNAQGLARAQTVITALSSVNPQTGAPSAPQENIAAFKKALSQGSLGQQEVVEQVLQYASNANSSSSFNPELKQSVYTLALDAGQEMLAERPDDARIESFMGMFFTQYGKSDDAIAHLQKAIKLSPNKQTLLFQLGQAYLQKGDTQEAIATLKQAFDLAPEFETARFMYVGALYAAKKNDVADALLKEQFNTTLVDNDQLLQIYTSVGLHDRVQAIWKMRIEKDPQNADLHLGLAQAYFSAGDVPSTVGELQKVAQLRPAQASQIQALITQIQGGAFKPQ